MGDLSEGPSPDQIEAAIRGERAAVTAITQSFLPRVYGLTLRMLRDREAAEDATQETFVRALRALPQLREHERFKSWLLTIAANTARETLRRRGKETALDYEPPEIEATVDERRVVQQKALELAMADLEQDERELFLLHTVEGMRLRDLADEHAVTVMAMKSRVHRIRSKVRQRALHHIEAAGVAV